MVPLQICRLFAVEQEDLIRRSNEKDGSHFLFHFSLPAIFYLFFPLTFVVEPQHNVAYFQKHNSSDKIFFSFFFFFFDFFQRQQTNQKHFLNGKIKPISNIIFKISFWVSTSIFILIV